MYKLYFLILTENKIDENFNWHIHLEYTYIFGSEISVIYGQQKKSNVSLHERNHLFSGTRSFVT